MPFLNDLITLLETDGVGTLNENLFTTRKQSIPLLVSGAATLQLTQTGGTDGERTQNVTLRPAFLKPTAQLMARADTPEAARALAQEAWDSCVKVRNQFINSGWYRKIKCLQSEPIDLGVDDRKQANFSFNVLAEYNRRD